jgi:hypothetical protein
MSTSDDESGPDASWVAIAYCACISAQLAFAGYAILYARRLSAEQATAAGANHDLSADVNAAEDFVKARGTQGRWRISWSFFAGSMGAWAITGPAAYAVHAGVLGMLSYALSCGLPTMYVPTACLHVLSVSICSLTRSNACRACYVCGFYATYASCVAYDLCACEARCESCVRTHTYVHSWMPNCTRVAAVASYTCRRISRQLGQRPAVCRTSQDNASAAAHAGTQFTYCTGTKVQI